MHLQPHDPADLTELDQRIAREANAKQRDRFRAARLALAGWTCPQIRAALGRSKDFVQTWAYAYRDGGLAALHPRKPPGRRAKLTPEQDAQLQARLDAGPRPADGVCALRGKDIQRLLEQEFGVTYTLDGVYDVLRRLGYRPLRPRPRHRKNDPAALAEFEARAPLLSSRCSRPTPSSASRSGSKMKPGSASRAR